jgi:hypothetical protein
MAKGKKRPLRRGKPATQKGTTRRAKVAKRSGKRSAARSKATKKAAKPKRIVAKKAAPRRVAPPKPAKPVPETPIEVIDVETVEELAPGVALVTDYQFVAVPEPSPAVPKGHEKKDNGGGQ